MCSRSGADIHYDWSSPPAPKKPKILLNMMDHKVINLEQPKTFSTRPPKPSPWPSSSPWFDYTSLGFRLDWSPTLSYKIQPLIGTYSPSKNTTFRCTVVPPSLTKLPLARGNKLANNFLWTKGYTSSSLQKDNIFLTWLGFKLQKLFQKEPACVNLRELFQDNENIHALKCN